MSVAMWSDGADAEKVRIFGTCRLAWRSRIQNDSFVIRNKAIDVAHPEHRLEQREEESREAQARRRRKRAAPPVHRLVTTGDSLTVTLFQLLHNFCIQLLTSRNRWMGGG